MITQPTGLPLREWADRVILDLERFGTFSKLEGPDWQNWAAQFLNCIGLGPYNLPSPYYYDDWRDWAERFVGRLY